MRKTFLTFTMILASIAVICLQRELTVSASSDSNGDIPGSEKSNYSDEHVDWELKYKEDFSEDLQVDDKPWERDDYGKNSLWGVNGELDDDGKFFHVKGGENFARHLDSFWLMRKRVSFGEDDWLTAELASRDYDKTGKLKDPVSFDNVTLENGDKGAKLDESDYSGGGLIRSTEPLPPEYRIEYKLKTIDFGGMRDGSFEYNGKVNGYDTEGTKTNFPWKASGSFEGPSDPSNPNFDDVRGENGFYFLSIVDYDNPAPHNNVFIHTHRKVNMDAYNVNGAWSDDYSICNPGTGELYNYNSSLSTRNGINALFMNGEEFKDHDMPYNEFLIETACGSYEGNIVSAAEIQPELMPDEDYKFAIERDKTGYTMEITGNFLHAGNKTLRFHRDFVEDDQPIYHYNNRPDQYDGQYDKTWDDGEYQIDHTWPGGSAYPDYFIIGDPHLTHYEGSATISDIKLYVPEDIDADYIRTRVSQFNDAGEFDDDKISSDLDMHLKAVEHYEKTEATEKVVKHMKGFKDLLTHQKNNNLIKDKAYNNLKEDADSLIDSYQ